MAFKSEIIERQIKIVKQTKKRLIILIMLIVIYCVTFVPNFITTILKNTLYAASGSLKPFNIIFSILALANPTLNSIVLLTLCLKSDDRYLNATSPRSSVDHEDMDENVNDRELDEKGDLKGNFKKLVDRVLLKRGLNAETVNAVVVTDRAIHERPNLVNMSHNTKNIVNKDPMVELSEQEPCLKRENVHLEEEVI